MLSFFQKNKKKSNSNLKILSGYNFRYRSVGAKSEKSIIKYANYFNFDYEFEKTNRFERHFYWLKIKMLIDNLEKGSHEFYLWLDADTFFCRYENILNHVDKTKHIFVHNNFFKSKHKTKYKFVHYLTWFPNVGVLLVRNTKWSLNFFKNVWNKEKYLKHFWPDNAAFMDEIGLKAEISKLSNNNLSKDVIKKVSFLPGIWNSMPKKNYKNPDNDEVSNFYFDPVIIHLAGIRRKDRLNFIREYKHLFI
tara:strand:- start:198 stop:944 length:747 start_codon:yes stop_codon:yes gene_type:complete